MTVPKAIHVCSAALFFVLQATADILPASSQAGEPNPLAWDALEKSADVPAMTNIAYFTFWVTNRSSAEATIISTETECDCTVAEAAKKLPWRLSPGEGGALN